MTTLLQTALHSLVDPRWPQLNLAPPHRKLLLDAPEEDPNYLPLPEEQPGPLQQ